MRRPFPHLPRHAVVRLLLYSRFAVDLAAVKEERLVGCRSSLGLAMIIFRFAGCRRVAAWSWPKDRVAHCGASLSFPLAFRPSMIAVFFNQTMPSRYWRRPPAVLGGEQTLRTWRQRDLLGGQGPADRRGRARRPCPESLYACSGPARACAESRGPRARAADWMGCLGRRCRLHRLAWEATACSAADGFTATLRNWLTSSR